MRPTRITSLDMGLAGIDRWRQRDEVHLPETTRRAETYLPEMRPLDAILRPPTLDDRLASQLVPTSLSPDLLDPNVLTATRQSLKARLEERQAGASPQVAAVLSRTAALLEREVALDAEISEALSVLLRG
jgi:hypothetical protein